MLVLTRKKHESVIIDDGRIIITVVEIRGDRIRLGIQADREEVSINRQEVWVAIQAEKSGLGTGNCNR